MVMRGVQYRRTAVAPVKLRPSCRILQIWDSVELSQHSAMPMERGAGSSRAFPYRSLTVAASMRRPPCVKRYADFFLFVHRYCPLPTNGRHSTPQPPVRGFFPAAIAIVPRRPTGGATSLPPTPLVFILRKVFLPLTTTPRCRPAGGLVAVRPAVIHHRSISPRFHSHSVRR